MMFIQMSKFYLSRNFAPFLWIFGDILFYFDYKLITKSTCINVLTHSELFTRLHANLGIVSTEMRGATVKIQIKISEMYI